MSSIYRKIWYFIWKDNSLLSWFVNVILAFILVRFIIYPGLGLLLGTSFPVVAVVSGSMEHNNDFNTWWQDNKAWYESNSIKKEEFINFPFKNGFNKGDIMVLYSAKNINIGDIVVYKANNKFPIIHRLVKIDPYMTKGDHNAIPDNIINREKILGKAILRIPLLGWIKIGFTNLVDLLRGL